MVESGVGVDAADTLVPEILERGDVEVLLFDDVKELGVLLPTDEVDAIELPLFDDNGRDPVVLVLEIAGTDVEVLATEEARVEEMVRGRLVAVGIERVGVGVTLPPGVLPLVPPEPALLPPVLATREGLAAPLVTDDVPEEGHSHRYHF